MGQHQQQQIGGQKLGDKGDVHQSKNSIKSFQVKPQLEDPIKNSQSIVVGGSSVVALKYKDGVMLAADTLGSYGSMKRYKDLIRFHQVNDTCIIAASGDLSDFQEIVSQLDKVTSYDYCMGDGLDITPTRVSNYLQKLLYDQRTNMDPLLDNVVVAGVENGKGYLAQVNPIGIQFTGDFAATGFARHLCVPIFYAEQKLDQPEEETIKIIQKGLKMLMYRDKQMINKFVIAKVTYNQGVNISKPFSVSLDWSYEGFRNPQIQAPGVW